MTAPGKRERLLLLVPTPREAELLAGAARGGARVVITGVGLAAAGAAAGGWFERLRPRAALLAGIAGTLDPRRLPVGALLAATRVACDGIGAGEGARFVSFERRTLALAAPRLDGAVRGQLLSVAAAAGSRAMAAARRRRHPRALAEEMEGHAVARAARLARVELTILRGVSNVAGERDLRRWRIAEAMAACRPAVARWIAEASR